MNQSKPHPILAAFLDYYFVSLSLLSLLVIIQALMGRVFLNSVILITIFVLLLVTDVIYHAWLSQKLIFLSYGERVAGKHLVKGKKTWLNPYKKNRFFLFLVIVISFLMIGSTWNSAVFLLLVPAFITGSIIKLAFIFLGAYLMGRGKIYGAFISMAPFLFAAFFMFAAYRASGAGIYLNTLIAFLVVIVGLLLSYFIYRKPVKII